MKSIITILVISYSLLAVQMPPMPPAIEFDTTKNMKKEEILKKVTKKNKKNIPAECKLLPQSVVFSPAPMEIMITNCKNKLSKPTIKNSKKNIEKLFGKNANIAYIKIVKEFNNLYEISINKKIYICNKTVNACFKKTKLIK